jgi:uncharacterized peroxidase-related enzyme
MDTDSPISLISDEAASPEVREVFENVRGVFGFIPNWVRMLARSPHVLKALLDFEVRIAGDGKIPRALKELAMTRTSELNGCNYCSAYHRHGLKACGVEESKATAIGQRERPGGGLFSEEETAVLDLTDEMTLNVRASPETVLRVKELFGEDGAVELMAAIGMLNCFNRIAFSAGLSPDAW